MSRDSRIKWTLIGLTICAAGALIHVQGLHFPPEDAGSPLGLAVLLAAAAAYYHSRNEESFVACLNALLHVTVYTACYAVLMYAAAVLNRPFVDDVLMRLDAVAGVHVPGVVAWSRAHPHIEAVLQLAYNSLLWQTPLVIGVLGFSGDRRALEQFVLQFMLGTWICLVGFCLWPAEGPFAGYGLQPSETQSRYLAHLRELREGVRTVATWRGAEGLITFPSFHTTWAVLLAWSVRRRPWLFGASVLLNGAVVIATMTTGWHYFADVVAGGAVAAAVVGATTRSAAQLQETSRRMLRRLGRFAVPAARRGTGAGEAVGRAAAGSARGGGGARRSSGGC